MPLIKNPISIVAEEIQPVIANNNNALKNELVENLFKSFAATPFFAGLKIFWSSFAKQAGENKVMTFGVAILTFFALDHFKVFDSAKGLLKDTAFFDGVKRVGATADGYAKDHLFKNLSERYKTNAEVASLKVQREKACVNNSTSEEIAKSCQIAESKMAKVFITLLKQDQEKLAVSGVNNCGEAMGKALQDPGNLLSCLVAGDLSKSLVDNVVERLTERYVIAETAESVAASSVVVGDDLAY